MHVEKLHVRQHAPHRLGERLPSAARQTAPAGRLEVVDEQESALLQIGAQPRGLAIGDGPPADLDDVRDRILEELGIVERHGVDLVMRAEEAHLVHDLHQVPLGERIAVDPGRTAAGPEAAGRGIVAHAHEREPAVVRNVGQGFVRTAEAVEAKLRERDATEREDADQRDHRRSARPSAACLHHGRSMIALE